eukprot:gene25786-31139_t
MHVTIIRIHPLPQSLCRIIVVTLLGQVLVLTLWICLGIRNNGDAACPARNSAPYSASAADVTTHGVANEENSCSPGSAHGLRVLRCVGHYLELHVAGVIHDACVWPCCCVAEEVVRRAGELSVATSLGYRAFHLHYAALPLLTGLAQQLRNPQPHTNNPGSGSEQQSRVYVFVTPLTLPQCVLEIMSAHLAGVTRRAWRL